MPDREQFLAERLTGVGGSDVHHLFSLPPYGCARRLFLEKTGAAPDFPPETTPAMERGTALEPIVAGLYQRRERRAVVLGGFHRHRADPWLLVHLDATVYRTATEPGVLECKCPGLTEFSRFRREGPPDSWTLQLQHALLVTGRAWGSLAVLNAERWEYLSVDVEADAEIQGRIREAARDFWGRVEAARAPLEHALAAGLDAGFATEAPPRLPAADRRCRQCPWRTQCQGEALLAAVAAEEAREGLLPGDLPEDESLSDLVRRCAETSALSDEAAALEEEARQLLREALGDRPGARCSAGKVLYRPHERTSIDTRGLRAAHPDIAEKFERTSVVRSLRVIPS